MKKFMRKYGGFVRMFLVLGLVICVFAAIIMYTLWEWGKWPVLKSLQFPGSDYRVEIVDWDTAGFFDTGEGSYVYFRHGSGTALYRYPWEDLDVVWAPDGANSFLTIETVEGKTEYRILEQKSGEDPDGVGSWSSTRLIPRQQEPDLQAVLTESCKTCPGFPTGWESISFRFVGWGGDSETVTFQFTTDAQDTGFVSYHYPTETVTKLYE